MRLSASAFIVSVDKTNNFQHRIESESLRAYLIFPKKRRRAISRWTFSSCRGFSSFLIYALITTSWSVFLHVADHTVLNLWEWQYTQRITKHLQKAQFWLITSFSARSQLLDQERKQDEGVAFRSDKPSKPCR